MSTVTVQDITEFAERVERMCEFILEGVEKDGSEDVVIIQKLKKDAADLQFIKKNANVSIEGLDAYIRGLPI
jgi:hypothetical protein